MEHLEVASVDDVDAILGVSGEVILDHAPDPGNTRLERLARFVAANLDPTIAPQHTGALSVIRTSRVFVYRAGERISMDLAGRREYSAAEAREIATALLRAADLAEDA